AQHKGVSTVLHEQNSVMGKANRLIAKDATAVATSFETTIGAPEKSIHTGNPVRADIEAVGALDFVAPTNAGKIHILVIGGSLGAAFLSKTIPAALSALPAETRARLVVKQQARGEDLTYVKEAYPKAGIEAEVLPFIDDVADSLSTCHLVICRAGATSVAEIAAAGRPAIFVPLDIHADRHQVINAESLANQSAAWVQPQSETSPEILTGLIAGLIENPNTLKEVANKAKSLAKTKSAKALHDLTLSISD
ncbi:MAG: UDP-N-acetylglucosamine--N-acetylmuramyl-(pentapeptide) pyrophosphoryl-undecaprenol N-acetylglucosamine transferase, partial [Alphaproteobacteria bacterium]